MKSLMLAVVAIFYLVNSAQAAKFDTGFTYSTIETAHFAIHYHQGLEAAAQKTARLAEETHEKLIREFKWQPAEKTQVILIDDSDFTNGLAITIPYNTIYLQVVPPSISSTLGEYDDWLRTLITHEYAHILSSDPARGYSKVTRAVFGKPLPWMDPLAVVMFLATAPPNTFMPRWWHEGMATWAETKHTGQGRGKGSYYDMIFRAAVAERNLPGVDRINGDVPDWPAGNLPYIYGYRLQRYIAETYGEDAAGRLTQAHAGRVPYTISAPAKANFEGRSYREVYEDMLAALIKEQSARIALLSQKPFTPLHRISDEGENLNFPRFSPDGSRIAFTRRDPHDHTSVVVTDASGERVLASFRRRFSDGSLSWSPDGKRIYFTQAEITRGFDLYQDLYVHDLDHDRTDRLTEGERLGEVQLSPDGKLFAAVRSGAGSQNLVLFENPAGPEKPKPSSPVTGYQGERVSAPRWSPDGRMVCYVRTDNYGRSSLMIYDLDRKTERLLISAGNSLAYPAWAPDGAVVYYVSDETGVFNVFAYDLKEGKSYQASHLLTGALQPEPSPDGSRMLIAHYTSRGFRIAALKLERSAWNESRGPSLPLTRALPSPASEPVAPQGATPRSPATESTASGSAAVQAAMPQTPAVLPSTSYSPLKTIAPRFWLPRFYGDGEGVAIGAYTAGSDALGYHTYAVSGVYSDGRKRGYGSLIYQNDSFYPTFTLRAHNEPFLYGDLYQTGNDYYELNRGVSVEAAVPLNRLESRYRLRAGYELLDQQALSDMAGDGTFHGVPVFEGRRDNLFAGIDFDNVLKYPYSISSEEGRRVSLLYRRYDKGFGSDIDLSEYSATWQEYLRLPIRHPGNHVLYLRLAGAFADGDLQYGQQAFQMGGAPSDLNPYPLRGYPLRSMTGRYVATGTIEYRAPIMYPLAGIGTVPAFAEKLHIALFADAGQVWGGLRPFAADETRVGAGVELRADLTIGYWAKVTPAIGFAHGFNKDGEDQIYFALYLGL